MALVEGWSLALSSMEGVGSETDLTAMVESYSSLLFRVVHSVLRNQAEAEDVVQDAFVRVLEHRRRLPEVRETRVWLIRIAWNLALDRRRRIKPEQFDEGFAEGLVSRELPADQALNEARRMKAVLREMERLPRAERDVLTLAAIEELRMAEMAEVLGRSESAVRALLFRARTRLRERLEEGRRG
ncbi:MAG TPA: sigma-70 family RNA polymerase sigma factor [Edaphobacter sp.]|jgi:RNA polymerase sigma-70 factor (ECF subfamily)|nr:sigma-70 family RNA polymerase sigma factor [Edaphobacter sp.]